VHPQLVVVESLAGCSGYGYEFGYGKSSEAFRPWQNLADELDIDLDR